MARQRGVPVRPERLHPAVDQTAEQRVDALRITSLLQRNTQHDAFFEAALAVVDGMHAANQLVGQISRRDVLRAFLEMI